MRVKESVMPPAEARVARLPVRHERLYLLVCVSQSLLIWRIHMARRFGVAESRARRVALRTLSAAQVQRVVACPPHMGIR